MINLFTKRTWICLLLILPFKVFSQDINVLTKEAEKLESSFHECDALEK